VGPIRYDDVAAALATVGMVARGAFTATVDDRVPALPDGRPALGVVMVGNRSDGAMWRRFDAERRDEPDPLDAWTRRVVQPIAAERGGVLIHPSDEPFAPILRWAQRADDVWPSPIGLLVHPIEGLWHAYRGALVFPEPVVGAPAVRRATSPCVQCPAPCLRACPVDAFAPGSYDHVACRAHVAAGDEPRCADLGCAARRACPVNAGGVYGAEQMRFHMRAFVGEH
jgi:hypothetical protein